MVVLGCSEVRVFRMPCEKADSCVLTLAGTQFFRRRLKSNQASMEVGDSPLRMLAKRPLPWEYHRSRRLSGAGFCTQYGTFFGAKPVTKLHW